MYLSTYLTTEMATISKVAKEKGIDNSIPEALIANAKWIGTNVYDLVMNHFQVPPLIWALYRNEQVNKRVGGDPGSWHKYAAAIDLDYDHLKTPTNSQLFYFLVNNMKEFDKIIWEKGNGLNPGWVHVQGKKDSNNRTITLAYIGENKKINYKHFTDLTTFETFKKTIYG